MKDLYEIITEQEEMLYGRSFEPMQCVSCKSLVSNYDEMTTVDEMVIRGELHTNVTVCQYCEPDEDYL